MLAFCDMKTLYLRNVPDEVCERLEQLARRAGMSVSKYAVHELAEAARRADNFELLGTLPDIGVPADVALEDLESSRSER